MKTTKSVLMLLAAGTLAFTACQSNNKPVTVATDTLTGAPYNDHMANSVNQSTVPPASQDPAVATTTTTTNEPVASNPNAVLIDTTEMVCVPRRKPVAQRIVATRNTKSYTKWRSKRKAKPVIVEETTVAVLEPVAPEPVIEPTIVTTVPEPVITYKQENTFTGNVPAPARRSKVHLGIEGGGNLNNLYMRSHNYETSNQLKVGYHGGLLMDVELGKRWDYQTGVRYIMKGGEETLETTNGVVTTEHKEKLTFHYIEMPMNIVYSTGEWGSNRFMIGAGPFVSWLASAQRKVKDKVTDPDGTVEYTSQGSMPTGHANSKPGNLRSFDAGAGAFIGYQASNGVYVKGGAEFGLLDMQKKVNTLGEFHNRNYNFLLTLGYMCGYKK